MVLSHSWPLLWFSFDCWGEGRRDPFSSLFKYKKTMPKELFYDFACQLSEYALNREPELFKNTRFWHHLFHALDHLCGWNFKSGRVIGLASINTEICEQVNSFLQYTKYIGSHLSPEHFVLFVQFFLYILNKNKTVISAKGNNCICLPTVNHRKYKCTITVLILYIG